MRGSIIRFRVYTGVINRSEEVTNTLDYAHGNLRVIYVFPNLDHHFEGDILLKNHKITDYISA